MADDIKNFGELATRFLEFSRLSINWCIAESDKSTASASVAIDVLLKKTERVSKISAAGLLALNATKKSLEDHGHRHLNPEVMADLIKSLTTLSKEHNEVSNVIGPIIEALQFQDRLRQRLENVVKITKVWLSARSQMPMQGQPDEFLAKLGDEMGSKTTSTEERDILRRYFVGMKGEIKVADTVTMF